MGQIMSIPNPKSLKLIQQLLSKTKVANIICLDFKFLTKSSAENYPTKIQTPKAGENEMMENQYSNKLKTKSTN